MKGPIYGYFPNAKKSVLLVKESLLEEANRVFEGTDVKVDTVGQRHLGAVIGTALFKSSYVKDKVKDWVASVDILPRLQFLSHMLPTRCSCIGCKQDGGL